jgi:hypothetical protein
VVNEQNSSFFRRPARKKLEQIHDFKQPTENLHSVSWRLDAEDRFHLCFGSLALKPPKLAGLPPQAFPLLMLAGHLGGSGTMPKKGSQLLHTIRFLR